MFIVVLVVLLTVVMLSVVLLNVIVVNVMAPEPGRQSIKIRRLYKTFQIKSIYQLYKSIKILKCKHLYLCKPVACYAYYFHQNISFHSLDGSNHVRYKLSCFIEKNYYKPFYSTVTWRQCHIKLNCTSI
jgi:hypothetical protein